MQHSIATLASAVALCIAATLAPCSAHAGVVTFNNPGPITIDASGIATYSEASFRIVGPAASFLTLDDALVGGFDGSVFSLRADGDALFALQSLQIAFYDLGFGSPPSSLQLLGLLNGTPVAAQQVALGALTTLSLGGSWALVNEVRFSAGGGFLLDNVTANAVPEPSSLALAGLGLLALAAQWRRGAAASP